MIDNDSQKKSARISTYFNDQAMPPTHRWYCQRHIGSLNWISRIGYPVTVHSMSPFFCKGQVSYQGPDTGTLRLSLFNDH